MTPVRRAAPRLGRLVAVVTVVGVGGGALALGAAAQTAPKGNQNTFNLAAEADALQATVTDPSLPVVTTVSFSPWGASAALNNGGVSLSDAGAPYSPFASSLPGTVNGLGGASGNALPPLPPAPGYVSANYPSQPTGNQTQAGYQISATASTDDAKGTVNLGAEQPGQANANLFAAAEATANPDGSVAVTAKAGMDVLNLGGLADLGNASSTVTLTEQASGAPKVTSSTNLGTVTLLGLPTGLSGGGLSLLGLGTPIPLSGSLAAVNAVLALSGITLTYLPGTFMYTDGTSSTGTAPIAAKTLSGVDSGALQVTDTKNVPSQGTVKTTLTLARVYATATDIPGFGSGGPSPGPGATGGSTTVGGTQPPSTGGSGGSPPSASASEAPTAGTGAVFGGGTAPGPSSGSVPSLATTGIPPAASPLRVASPSVGAQLPLLRSPVPLGPSGTGFYLLLVLGGLVSVAGSQLIRLVAVRQALSRRTVLPLRHLLDRPTESQAN
jgi:hypothetical protein